MVIAPSQSLKRALIKGGITKMKIYGKEYFFKILKLKVPKVYIEIKCFKFMSIQHKGF